MDFDGDSETGKSEIPIGLSVSNKVYMKNFTKLAVLSLSASKEHAHMIMERDSLNSTMTALQERTYIRRNRLTKVSVKDNNVFWSNDPHLTTSILTPRIQSFISSRASQESHLQRDRKFSKGGISEKKSECRSKNKTDLTKDLPTADHCAGLDYGEPSCCLPSTCELIENAGKIKKGQKRETAQILLGADFPFGPLLPLSRFTAVA